jgi:hypothetical protein
MKTKLILFYLLLATSPAWGRPPLDLNQDVAVPADTPDPKQAAFRKAIDDASTKLISESVGSDAVEKHSAAIKQILSKSEKYILFIKGSTPETVGEETHVKVDMKISLDNLDTALREAGLLQASTHVLSLLPLLSFHDETTGENFSWWVNDSKAPGNKRWAKMERMLSQKLKARNIHLLEIGGAERVLPAMRKQTLSREEQLELAKQLDASLIVTGSIRFTRDTGGAKAQVQASFLQARGGKLLGETQTIVGPAKESDLLFAKVADVVNDEVKSAQASGHMNIASFNLVVDGRLAFAQLERLRKEILDQVLEIRSLKDRLYSADHVVFEGESNKSTTELAQQIRRTKFTGLKVDAQDSGSGAVVLTVRSL